MPSYDRPALYYPHIYFRDLSWVKSALLTFGQLRRMRPLGYRTRDPDEIRRLTDSPSFGGRPAIQDEPVAGRAVANAQATLARALSRRAGEARKRFSAKYANAQFGGDDLFAIHADKVMPELMRVLHDLGLVWYRSKKRWYAVHPRVGDAIMSTIAVTLAAEHGLAIVTDDVHAHSSFYSGTVDGVVASLFGDSQWQTRIRRDARAAATEEVAHLVITTTFDVRQLTFAQVLELVRNERDLRRIKERLFEVVARVPPIQDPVERRRRLLALLPEIRDEWSSYQASLPAFARALFGGGLRGDLAGVARSLVPAALAGTITIAAAGQLPGLAVGVVSHAATTGYSLWRRSRDNPYRYLSRIRRTGAAVLAVPLVESLGRRRSNA